TTALPVLPSLVAVIVTALAATPVTSPVEETVAVAGALDAHVIVRPESTVPAASFALAVSWTLAPTSTSAVAGLITTEATRMFAPLGATTTEATGTLDTVTVVVPVWPSLVAVMVAVPRAMPVISPVLSTGATAPLLVVHATARPERGLPFASLTVAPSRAL